MKKQKPTYIYRLYHKHTGLLVYLGASVNPKNRFKQHMSSTFKGVPLKQVVGEVFDDRQTALAFEKKAIKKERPMDNVRDGHKHHMFRQEIKDKKRNVTVTQLSEKQYEWLLNESATKALTLTTIIKVLIEEKMKADGGISK